MSRRGPHFAAAIAALARTGIVCADKEFLKQNDEIHTTFTLWIRPCIEPFASADDDRRACF